MRCLAGFGAGASYGVHSNTVVNLARGIAERVLYVVRGGALVRAPQPIDGCFESRLSKIRKRLLGVLRPTPIVPIGDYHQLYSGRKQAIYKRAADSLLLRGVEIRDSVVKTFVKAEKVNFSAKGDPAPRVIQPRDPRYTLSVGRYLKLFESQLCHGFKKLWGYAVILKGLNATQVATTLRDSWERYTHPCAIGLDASRFDQHVSMDALRFEHSIYNGVFKSAELRQLLQWQLRNKGIGRAGDGSVKYKVDGCRMSGDINTDRKSVV